MPYCCAVSCTNDNKSGCSLYRFPADPVRRRVWVENCQKANWTPTPGSRLCEEHFEAGMFENYITDNGRKKLRPNAVPTLFHLSESHGTNNKPNMEKHAIIRKLVEAEQNAASSGEASELDLPHDTQLNELYSQKENENGASIHFTTTSEAVSKALPSRKRVGLTIDQQIKSVHDLLQANRRQLLHEKRCSQKYKQFLSQFLSQKEIEKMACHKERKESVRNTIQKALKISDAFGKRLYRCRKWVINTLREDLRKRPSELLNVSHSLCAEHFEDNMFMNAKQKRRLVHDALPTIFNISTPLPPVNPPRKRGRPPKRLLAEEKSPLAVSLVAIQMDHKYYSRNFPSGHDVTGDSPDSGVHGIVNGGQCDFLSDEKQSYVADGVIANKQRGTPVIQQVGGILVDINRKLSGMAAVPQGNTVVGISKKNAKSVETQTEPPPRTVNRQTWMTRPFKTAEDVLLRKRLAKQREALARLQKKLDTLKEQYKQLEEAPKSFRAKDLIKGLEQHLSGVPLAFVTTQLLMAERKIRTRKWPEEIKKFAMSVYKAGPRAYEILTQQLMLPSVKSIRQLVAEEREHVNSTIDSVVESCVVEEGSTSKDALTTEDQGVMTEESSVPVENNCNEANAAVMMICENVQNTSGLEHGELQWYSSVCKTSDMNSVGNTIECVIESSDVVEGVTDTIAPAQQQVVALDTPPLPVVNPNDKQNAAVVVLCQNLQKTPTMEHGGLQWYSSLCRTTELEFANNTVSSVIKSGVLDDGAVHSSIQTPHVITLDTSALPLVNSLEQNTTVSVQCQPAQPSASLEHGEIQWYSIVTPWTGP